ncbi:MAG: hypothetical protein WCS01_02365 [bacterium]
MSRYFRLTGGRVLLRPLGVVGLIGVGLVGAVGAEDGSWQIEKSKHFLVHYTVDATEAGEVATRAEKHYETIAADLGFTRYGEFWLWDRRVKIVIYPSAQAFAAACRAPVWAAGKADARRREIDGYHQGGKGFLEEVLPHEMAHLILDDFIGTESLPLWVAEGFAQWEQYGRTSLPFALDAQGTGRLPFAEWVDFDVRREPDSGRAVRYYRQSASVVGFLISEFGGERFGSFCRALRDGKKVEDALKAAYADQVPGLAPLEKAWAKYVEGNKR